MLTREVKLARLGLVCTVAGLLALALPTPAGAEKTQWFETAKLTAPDAAAGDGFGDTLSLAGNNIVVGSTRPLGTGHGYRSYVFTPTKEGWVPNPTRVSPPSPEAGFGEPVALSGDTIVVGARFDDGFWAGAGSVSVVSRAGLGWSASEIAPSDGHDWDGFGAAVAASGSIIVVGADGNDHAGTNAGSAYVFTRTPTAWVETAKLTASDAAPWDAFGTSVAVSGDTIVVGARGTDQSGTNSGAAYVFSRTTEGWIESSKLTPSDATEYALFGRSVAISGRVIFVAAFTGGAGTHSGSVYVFTP